MTINERKPERFDVCGCAEHGCDGLTQDGVTNAHKKRNATGKEPHPLDA